MMRYLAFAFPHYYPVGGWDDLVGAYSTEADARAAAAAWKVTNAFQLGSGSSIQIVDLHAVGAPAEVEDVTKCCTT